MGVSSWFRSPSPDCFRYEPKGRRLQERVCLLTGGGGFIGSHLARRLISRGAQVHLMIRHGTSLHRIGDLIDQVVVDYVDLRDEDGVRRAVHTANPEFVFHFATPSRGLGGQDVVSARRSVDEIVVPLISLIEAAGDMPRPPRAFIRAGTIAEYGAAPMPFRENQLPQPKTAYGAAMLAGTQLLHTLQPGLAFPVVTTRLALTYGAGQSETFLIPKLVSACLAGEPIRIERPDDRRDLIHVDDVVDAMLAVGETSAVEPGAINVSTGIAPSMREVAAEIVASTRCDPALIEQNRQTIGKSANVLSADPARARRMYAWAPRIGLQAGLSRLVQEHRRATAQTVRPNVRIANG